MAKMGREAAAMWTLMVAAVLLSGHHRPALAEDSLLAQEGELAEGENSTRTTMPWGLTQQTPCIKFLDCFWHPGANCMTDCCTAMNWWGPLGNICHCWRIANSYDKQGLIYFSDFCNIHLTDICKRIGQVGDNSEAIDDMTKQQVQLRIKPTPNPKCCAKDQLKIKSCMYNATSGAAEDCCPTFKAMLNRNCACYNYANDLDDQLLTVVESLCDVSNPCNRPQVM